MKDNLFRKVLSKIQIFNASISELLDLEDSATKPERKQFVIDNDAVIYVDGELGVSSIVYDANEQLFTAGEYHLKENGSLVRIDEYGVITEFVQAPQPIEASKDEIKTQTQLFEQVVSQSKENKPSDENNIVIETKKEVAKLTQKIIDIEAEFAINKALNEKLQKEIEMISNSPAEKPLVNNSEKEIKQITSSFEKDKLYNKLAEERFRMFKNKK